MTVKELEQPLSLETDLFNGLKKEILQVNSFGSYLSTTVVNCNTRKYHGLFVARQPQFGHDNYVFLSGLIEHITTNSDTYSLSTHQFPNTFHPKGYRYITQFKALPHPTWQYKVHGTLLQKEIILLPKKDRVIIRYSNLSLDHPVQFSIKPLLAFRRSHDLVRANTFANKHFYPIANGCAYQLYENFDYLNIQFSKKTKYTHAPEWHYNFEYQAERQRGYDYQEDLLVPGFFDFKLEPLQKITLSIGLKEASQSRLSELGQKFESNRSSLGYEEILSNAADQFINSTPSGKKVCAGYPWFGTWGRDTFIALPGLTLARKKTSLFTEIVDSYLQDLKQGLFPNIGSDDDAAYNSVDASLWFFKAISEYHQQTNKPKKTWNKYGSVFKSILNAYRYGTENGIIMHTNGLIYAEAKGKALTWMDAVVHTGPVTQRPGYCVEINALWYNAIVFCLELAQANQDHAFIEDWKDLPKQIESSYQKNFTDKNHNYLADYVHNDETDWSIRPNQIIACAVIHSPISQQQQASILQTVKEHLLTPREYVHWTLNILTIKGNMMVVKQPETMLITTEPYGLGY